MAVKGTFIDTLFVIALINKRDQYHEQADEMAVLYDGQPLITTDAILLEIGNAMARAFKPEAAQVIEDFLTSEDVQVVQNKLLQVGLRFGGQFLIGVPRGTPLRRQFFAAALLLGGEEAVRALCLHDHERGGVVVVLDLRGQGVQSLSHRAA